MVEMYDTKCMKKVLGVKFMQRITSTEIKEERGNKEILIKIEQISNGQRTNMNV